MSRLYRRNGSSHWWVDFYAPNGKRIRKSTGTDDKKKAQEFFDNLKNKLWRIYHFGERPRRKWNEAVQRWLNESSELKSLEQARLAFKWLAPFLDGLYLDEINRDLLDQILQERKAMGVANSTVNRTLQIVRGVMMKAHKEWEWLDRLPAFRFLPQPDKRVRWLTRAQADRLIRECPEHLAEMVRFTLAVGLRAANVFGLEWSQIDLARATAWIHPDQAKAGKAIKVPLNRDALSVLHRQLGKHETHVFTYQGKPVMRIQGKAWRKALDRAGIRKYDGIESKTPNSPYPCHDTYAFEDFRWHDLRHTWASWLVQAGTPLYVLQELGGWSDYEMVQKYAHLATEHLAPYVENLCQPTVCDQNVTYIGHKSGTVWVCEEDEENELCYK